MSALSLFEDVPVYLRVSYRDQARYYGPNHFQNASKMMLIQSTYNRPQQIHNINTVQMKNNILTVHCK